MGSWPGEEFEREGDAGVSGKVTARGDKNKLAGSLEGVSRK